MYDGRTIRVQLRDRQPSRHLIKFRRIVPGRARDFNHNEGVVERFEPWRYNRHQAYDVRSNESTKPWADASTGVLACAQAPEHDTSPERSLSMYNPRVGQLVAGVAGGIQVSTDAQATRQTADSNSTTPITPPPPFTPTPFHTPGAPSSGNPSGGYYATQGWPQYHGQVPYAMPYGSYAGIVAMHPPPSVPMGGTVEGTQVMNTPMHWGLACRVSIF